METATTVEDLNGDVLLKIFGLVREARDLVRAMGVCRAWKEAASSVSLVHVEIPDSPMGYEGKMGAIFAQLASFRRLQTVHATLGRATALSDPSIDDSLRKCLRYAEIGPSVEKFLFLAARVAEGGVFSQGSSIAGSSSEGASGSNPECSEAQIQAAASAESQREQQVGWSAASLPLKPVVGPTDHSLRLMMPVIVFAIIRGFDDLLPLLPPLVSCIPSLENLLVVDLGDNVTLNVRPHHMQSLRQVWATRMMRGSRSLGISRSLWGPSGLTVSASSPLATTRGLLPGVCSVPGEGSPTSRVSSVPPQTESLSIGESNGEGEDRSEGLGEMERGSGIVEEDGARDADDVLAEPAGGRSSTSELVQDSAQSVQMDGQSARVRTQPASPSVSHEVTAGSQGANQLRSASTAQLGGGAVSAAAQPSAQRPPADVQLTADPAMLATEESGELSEETVQMDTEPEQVAEGSEPLGEEADGTLEVAAAQPIQGPPPAALLAVGPAQRLRRELCLSSDLDISFWRADEASVCTWKVKDISVCIAANGSTPLSPEELNTLADTAFGGQLLAATMSRVNGQRGRSFL